MQHLLRFNRHLEWDRSHQFLPNCKRTPFSCYFKFKFLFVSTTFIVPFGDLQASFGVDTISLRHSARSSACLSLQCLSNFVVG